METAERIKVLMNELDLTEDDRKVVAVALKKAEKEKRHVISLQLPNGKIITGKQTELLNPASSLLINAMKELTHIPDEIDLLSPSVLEPIQKFKSKDIDHATLNLQEVIIALSICSVTNPIIAKAFKNLKKLAGCEAHASYIVTNGDKNEFRNLKINLTTEPQFYSNDLFEIE